MFLSFILQNLESPRGCNAEHNSQETSAGTEKNHCMTLSQTVRDFPTASSCAVSGKMQKTEDEIMRVAKETVRHTVLPQDQHRCTRSKAEIQKPHSSVDKPRRRSTICQKLSHFCAKMSRKDAVIHEEAQTQDLMKHRTLSFHVTKLSISEIPEELEIRTLHHTAIVMTLTSHREPSSLIWHPFIEAIHFQVLVLSVDLHLFTEQ